MKAVALLCDVRGSRDLPDRSAFGRMLRDTLRLVTREHRSDLLTRLELQAGIDEFGAVLEPDAVGTVVLRLWEELPSTPVRYALAAGSVDVLVEPSGESGPDTLAEFSSADGPALHSASDLLDGLRDSGSLFGAQLNGPQQASGMLSLLAEMTYLHILSWTARQAEIFFSYRRSGIQTDTAKELGIQQSTVSHTLSRLEHRPLLRSLDRIEGEMNNAVGSGE